MNDVRDMPSPAPEQEGSRPAWLATGSILGALAASSCCILPLALFSIGATGAWIGALGSLAPYQPIFVLITVGFLAGGYWLVYRKPKADCVEGTYCASPVSSKIVKGALWAATALVVAAAAFPYAAPLILES